MTRQSMGIFSALRLSLLALVFCVAGLLFVVHASTKWDHFSAQAHRFLERRLDIPAQYKHDSVHLDGKIYWPLGPFPSILLIPFEAISSSRYNQAILQLILVGALSIMLFRLARLKGFSSQSAFYLVSAFLLASMAFRVIIEPKSWYLAQVVAMTGLTAALLEWETKRRPWVLGLLIGVLLATRPPAAFIFFLFLPLLWLAAQQKNQLKTAATFLLPVVLFGAALLWFNYARFGNPFDNGYGTAMVGPYSDPVRELGMFHPRHIVSNFYYYFLASVHPVTAGSAHLVFPFYTYRDSGLSLLLVAPFFLTAFAAWRLKDRFVRGLWWVAGATMLFLLVYYHSGWVQFGPRYMLDFFPIIFLLTLYGLGGRELTAKQQTLIVVSALINAYLILSRFWL